MRPLWEVADTAIWTYPCSKVHCDRVAMSELVVGWEQLVDGMAYQITPWRTKLTWLRRGLILKLSDKVTLTRGFAARKNVRPFIGFFNMISPTFTF